ncbi:MAG: FecR domain-containing protein [Alphaproteobacteria bacterium]
MSGNFNPTRHRDINAQAAAWCVRLHSEAASEADFIAFEQWLNAPGARDAYDAAELTWTDVDAGRAPIIAAMNAQDSASAERGKARVSTSRRVWLFGGLAAACAVMLAVVIIPKQPVWNGYATKIGETRTIALADGSSIRLNTNSSVRVALGARDRRVEMGEGEVSFDIAHDAKRPFIVDISGRRVEVLGTEFNIRDHADTLTLTVRRGAVSFKWPSAEESAPVQVAAGDQLVQRVGYAPILRTIDPAAAFSWQTGILIYTDAPLDEIISDLNRYFVRPISVQGPAIAQLRFSGALALGGEEQVVGTLEKYLPVQAEFGNKAIVLHAKPAP